MKKTNTLILAALVIILASIGNLAAQERSNSTPTPLAGQDYEEIKALYSRYNQGSDFRDAELFLSAFAEDAVMTRGGRDIEGMNALRADREARYQGQTGDVGRRHLNSSFLITATESGASSKAYYILVDVTVRPQTIVSSGYYHDEFVRTPEGWKIKQRTLFTDTAAQ